MASMIIGVTAMIVMITIDANTSKDMVDKTRELTRVPDFSGSEQL